jgi:uncharacterized protein
MGEKSKQDIEKIVEVLLRMFNQVEVIIFGSVANGTERDNSDIDVCLILDIGAQRKIDIIRNVRRNIVDVVDSPIDILVYDRGEFDIRSRLTSSFEYKILQEGVKVA